MAIASKAERGRLAVIVVNYGSSHLLERNLVPLTRALGSVAVVVDNRTDDVERERVTACAEREGWAMVLPETNTGFGEGMNLGVARARRLGATEFLLLNPDATISSSAVTILRQRVKERPLTLIAPKILRPDGTTWFDGSDLVLDDGRIRASRRREPGQDRYETWLTGACLMVSERLWQLVGGFDEAYFLYWEDVDLSHRVREAGGELEVCADAIATHAEGGTHGEGLRSAGAAKSSTYYYFNIKNRLVFAAHHLDNTAMLRWRRSAIAVAYEVLLQGGRRQFLKPRSPVWAALRGLHDGRGVVRRELRERRRRGMSTPTRG